MPQPASVACRFCLFADYAMGQNGPVMECHRQPPIGDPGGLTLEVSSEDVPPEAMEEFQAVQAIAELEMPRWPRIREDDWCGEFKRSPEASHPSAQDFEPDPSSEG